MLYFLNDVEEGGETAFPIADNATADSKVRVYVLSVKYNTLNMME